MATNIYQLILAVLVVAIGYSVIIIITSKGASKVDFATEFGGQHILITGGSSGLGKEIARQLLAVGAIVTLVARGRELLDSTANELLNGKKGADVKVISCDVTAEDSAKEMIEQAEKASGPIDMVFCCAGAALPGFFIEQTPKVFATQMTLNYLGAVNVIHPAIKRMVDLRRKGRIIFISSTLGLTGMIGYTQYSPTKFALRGMAESLRQELLPYNINVHIYFVATITSPGQEAENRIKPQITKKIEEGDTSNPSPAARATILLDGIVKNEFAISSDHITDIFLRSSLGAAPGSSNILYDIFTIPLAHWGLLIWRKYADWLVVSDHRKGKEN